MIPACIFERHHHQDRFLEPWKLEQVMTYFMSLTGKQFWALNTAKLQVSLSQMRLRLDTNQVAGVQCECGAWDLLEDIAICVFLAGDHGVWTKMNYELLGYFKSWKMNLWECCTQYASKLGKLSSGHGTEKVSFHSNPKERQCQRMLKLPHNCTHLTR